MYLHFMKQSSGIRQLSTHNLISYLVLNYLKINTLELPLVSGILSDKKMPVF
mgnify:CR=1 FL=1